MMKKIVSIVFAALIIIAGCDKTPQPVPAVLTFENIAESYLAGPTSAGESIHNGYTGYSDPVTGLKWESISTNYNGVYYWSSGIAISRWTDNNTFGPDNQCSVYTSSGSNGSKTFAVNFSGSPLIFEENSAEYIIEEMWVMNASYTAISMRDGDSFCKKFSYAGKDWLKLTITGYDKDDLEKGKVEVYLADFRTENAPGIMAEWTKVTLSSIGKVHKLGFSLSSSDVGDFGMNTPNYFCFDNLVVKK